MNSMWNKQASVRTEKKVRVVFACFVVVVLALVFMLKMVQVIKTGMNL